ncbi:MAG TPA: DUF1348 family protein, partial [Candidatus Methylacidiphilales bacterium]|nr:DUF1348 family protein [Candidatus Methylacidiphilales bacterium]
WPAPLPPFAQESATQKVRLAEEGWNSRDPEKVPQTRGVHHRARGHRRIPHAQVGEGDHPGLSDLGF